MDHLVLDLRGVETEADFHDLLATVIEFPHYYGRNADAFWECLTEIVEPTTVHVVNLPRPDQPLRLVFDKYLRMMREWQQDQGGNFLVILEP